MSEKISDNNGDQLQRRSKSLKYERVQMAQNAANEEQTHDDIVPDFLL